MKYYEAARKKDSMQVDKILPSLSIMKSKRMKRKKRQNKISLRQKSLENLMNISQFNGSVEEEEELDIDKELGESEEEDSEKKIDKEKYEFLQQATGYSIDQLNSNEKEDSFMQSTKPLATIVNYLGEFKGLFTRRSLEAYYYEALFILEQDYANLKKTLMVNEVIRMAIAIIQNEMFPSDTFMPNIYSVLFQGIFDVITGEEKVYYPHKLIKKFCKAMETCLEKEKLKSFESVDAYLQFVSKVKDKWDLLPEMTRNFFIGNYLDFIWYFSSDFNYFLKKKEPYDVYNFALPSSLAEDLKFFLSNITDDESLDSVQLKIQRLVYMEAELLSESWDEDTIFNQKEKRLIVQYFEVLFVLMGEKWSKSFAFQELRQKHDDGVFLAFDRYFMLITKQSHPSHLEEDFGLSIKACARHWKAVFQMDKESQEDLDLKLGVLIQINMILYQIVKSFNLYHLSDYMIDFVKVMIQASIDLINSLTTIKRKKGFTKDIRSSFDEILAKINFSRVPKRLEESLSEMNELIICFLTKIDKLK
jgi:hypothetical protein